MHIERTPQVIPGLLARGGTLLAGDPKKGKSTIALNWCIAVASRDEVAMGRLPCEHGAALYLCLEDNWERLQGRLDKALMGKPKPERLHFALEWLPVDQGGDEQFDAWMEMHPDTKLIVVDTFEIVRPTENKSENVYRKDYRDVRRFKTVGDRHQIAVLLIHHLSKGIASGDADIFRRFNGSQGMLAAADTSIALESAPDSLVGTLHFRGRDVGHGKTQLYWNPTVETWFMDEYGEVGKRSPKDS